jgi:sugar lactone lactonase YvrE
MEDSQGRMWFGTLGDGIAIFDGQTWIKHNRSTGALTDDSVRSLIEDDQGRFWVATDGGVNLLVRDGLWLAYTVNNSPLPHDFVNVLLMDSKDNLWIGTQGGLAVFRPGDAVNPVLDQARRRHADGADAGSRRSGTGPGYNEVSGGASGEPYYLKGPWDA